VKPGRRSGLGSLVELVVIVATAIGLALAIQAFIVKPFKIPSGSMEPTLKTGERVLVDRIGTHFHDPELGDIVVFHPPQGAPQGNDAEGSGRCANSHQGQGHEQACDKPTPGRQDGYYIKRVVGLPGDHIAIKDGRVIRNGRPEADSYINHSELCTGSVGDCTFPHQIVVPPGYYFMMGDNRANSADSRYWGPVPKSWIIGGAFASYWPPNRIGII
jgi:signal peptidase I